MSIQEMKAHEEKISAQLHEVKALIEEVEAHAKKHKAQAEIEKVNDLKAKKQGIEKKWEHHLKTAGEAAVALHAKAEIEAELEKLKSSLEEASAKSRTRAVAK
jgi:hypothetical protein